MKISLPWLKWRWTGAGDGSVVLYFKKKALVIGYAFNEPNILGMPVMKVTSCLDLGGTSAPHPLMWTRHPLSARVEVVIFVTISNVCWHHLPHHFQCMLASSEDSVSRRRASWTIFLLMDSLPPSASHHSWDFEMVDAAILASWLANTSPDQVSMASIIAESMWT